MSLGVLSEIYVQMYACMAEKLHKNEFFQVREKTYKKQGHNEV
jgi:hypothetical protein